MDKTAFVPGSPEEGRASFRTLFDTYSPAAMALAVNVLGNRADAEDACQEAFVQVYRNLERYDPRRSFKTWFTAILYRRCLDQLRRRRRSAALIKKAQRDPAAMPVVSDASVPGRGEPGLPARLLDHLNSKERLALCLWANDGYSAAEISGVLRCSPGTARVYLFQARKKIKKLLEKDHAFLQRC
jgi:RNA polymerase sigma-70 factor (ECF subfamily)